MSIRSIIKSLLTSEPQKSRIKAGITSEDGSLTQEGRDAFVQFIFDGGDVKKFDETIVKPIVAEIEKNK